MEKERYKVGKGKLVIGKKGKKKMWIIIGGIIGILLITCGIFAVVMNYRLGQIPSMTYEDMLEYVLKDNKEGVVTVGIIKDGEMSYNVYGENGIELPAVEHEYEIGSLTKTFTGAILCKAIEEGKVSLDDSIDKYLELPEGKYYPTLRRLVTHTSGYKGYYMEGQMVSNFFRREANDFYGIDVVALEKKVADITLHDKDYPFNYSNFGLAVVGDVLAKVYEKSYSEIMEEFLADDLQLKNTHLSSGEGELGGFWRWKAGDAYMPAGALISNISDMMQYVKMQMNGEISYMKLEQQKQAMVHASSKQHEQMGIRIDSAAVCWMMDEENGLIWHNGGTSNYNSYAAFDVERQIGVVILTNMSPAYRIPATVYGVKLMQNLQQEE